MLMDIIPVPMVTKNPYFDILTSVFCIALVLLSINCTVNRKQFKSILQALFLPRVRNQLLREGKIFNEWIYFLAITYVFIIQAALVYLLAWNFLPRVLLLTWMTPILLYAICFGAVVADYFLKMLIVRILAFFFDCSAACTPFNLNKFFYLTINSVALLPILILAVYLNSPFILMVYCPIFLVVYFMMIFRTITFNSNLLNPFHFFLYFCTLEILPYLIYLKLLITYANTTI